DREGAAAQPGRPQQAGGGKQPPPDQEAPAPEDQRLGQRPREHSQRRRRQSPDQGQEEGRRGEQDQERAGDAAGDTPPHRRRARSGKPGDDRALSGGREQEQDRDQHPGQRVPGGMREQIQERPQPPDPRGGGQPPHAGSSRGGPARGEFPEFEAPGHRSWLSSRRVTGPSLWISTTMCARNRPGTTRTPSVSSERLNSRYSGSACSGGAARTKLGRRPPLVSA